MNLTGFHVFPILLCSRASSLGGGENCLSSQELNGFSCLSYSFVFAGIKLGW
ncbi:hypothetical protein B0T26DRAFT_729819 [Lasiosphaeria miniovina]|uniref:Uncharacterized protein n=1 Tax=Lasiosphaeria miniovina TaxID=1954250 RepID=A0AA39ZT09_9PEZI|nr:uncharacterized protein B0T26DRAFT_729819 [Lasiosphaeria miniovina]KAK0703097.1 hypothetical protein B0T26DRAFT_729819 [Lasiosphaeria miniovina]